MPCAGAKRPGAPEKQFLQLLTQLDRDRIEPHLAVFRSTLQMEKLAAFQCPVRVLHIGKLLRPGSLWKLMKLCALVRAERFELVHIFLTDASIAAPFFCRLGGADVIVSRRDMGFWYGPLTLKVLRFSNLFVNRDDHQQRGGQPERP